MGKIIKLRKSGKSLIITIPMAICQMFNLKEGSQVEIEPFTSNSMQLKVK
jgi:antitoxin component of MazEF toxin-antitoxin module